MNKVIRTIQLLLITILVIGMTGVTTFATSHTPSPPAAPEVPNDELVDEPVAQVDCFNGKQNFGSFLRSFIAFDQFGAFFQDIQMNACQYISVKILKDDLKSLREEIRNAYYTCDSGAANNLRIEYNRKDAELFFLRNLISTQKNVRVATELPTLRNIMEKEFVKQKKYFIEKPVEGATNEVFSEVWANFTEKYDAQAYLDCKGDTELIQEKIESLRDTIDGIVAEFKQDKAEIEDRVERTNTNGGNKNASEAELKLNAMSIFARAINEVSPGKAARDIQKEFQNKSFSQLELSERLAEESRRYEMDLKRAKKLARYKAKYQHTTDAISSDYSERVGMLISTLDNATVNMTSAKGCLEFVNETQCSE